jgi:hypothetical protein
MAYYFSALLWSSAWENINKRIRREPLMLKPISLINDYAHPLFCERIGFDTIISSIKKEIEK